MEELADEVLTVPATSCAASTQLSLAWDDALAVHYRERNHIWAGFSTLNYRNPGDPKLHEKRFQANAMPLVIANALRDKPGADLYLALHSYKGARTLKELLSINAGFADLDFYNTNWIEHTADEVCARVLERLDDWKIPRPSYIVDSGRGLQLYWIYSEELSPGALPIWTVTHRYLVEDVLADFGADGAAILPTQITRMVGSTNQKNGRPVRIVWSNTTAGTVCFKKWFAAILPFTREEARAYKANKRANRAQYLKYDKQNKANLKLLAEKGASCGRRHVKDSTLPLPGIGARIDISPGAIRALEDLEVGEIWQRRMSLIPRLLQLRGITEPAAGDRHKFTWVIANALAWIHRNRIETFKTDLIAYAANLIPSYTSDEILSAAASVLKRIGQSQAWGTGLYKMSEAEFRKKLGVTDKERLALSNGTARRMPATCNVGAMHLPTMKSLTFREYEAETTRRQAAAAARTNAMMDATSAPFRLKAQAMRAAGSKQREIAAGLGVSQQVVSKWLKKK